ncbi:hypothetical protein J5N97_005932 [Dioscorea zingiberensis]|uniref:U-box domain-containing protein n=1 Tax=Dioscorea zingiberensis TaxID=325984 RepID=A0A9D5D8Y8_9LILI|nr:hypothetical protein J5N97_005932 [Dioscorea zingiberensis]
MASRRSRRAAGEPELELATPTHFRCPISLELMKDPVTVSTGITYDRQSIERWLDMGHSTCPVTNQSLGGELELIPNHAIRRMIQDWCVTNRSFGVERIPTPRIPVSPVQASNMLSEMALASRLGDVGRCGELVGRVKALVKESERNRRCFVSSGAGRVLSCTFSEFAVKSLKGYSIGAVLEEILSVISSMAPLDEDACWYLRSPESMSAIVSILQSGDLGRRLNAVLVVKELVSRRNENGIETVAKTEGLVEALVKLIKEPISPQTTKASLVATYYLVSSGEKTAERFVDMGIVSLLLEILVDSEKSMSEKALAVLDSVLVSEKAKKIAYDNALSLPVLVKKMFRISDMATEFAVSAIWKLCKKGGEECLVEALQVGAFQKLLLLLQVGCSSATKEKATELLKLLNGSKRKLECIDVMDFRGLKRPL